VASILLVEDDLMSCEVLAKLLRRSGHSVVCASNGLEALDALGALHPDVIVLDLMMPVMNGVEFLKIVRRVAKWAVLPVIVLSALNDGPEVCAVEELGVARRFVKGTSYYDDLLRSLPSSRSHDDGTPPTARTRQTD
jgi:CheY-like chemotaxis protein